MVLTFDSVDKIFKGDQRNLLSSSFGAVYCAVNDGSNIYFWEWNFHNVTIEMKANVHYFSVVLFIKFYMVILHVTFYPNPFTSTLTWNNSFSTTLLN